MPDVSLSRRAVRFTLVGVLVTGVHVVVTVAIMEWVLHQSAVANTTAFLIASTVSYLLNSRWSFSAELRPRTFVRFATVTGLGMVLAALVSAAVDHAGHGYPAGIAAVVLLMPPLTFLAHQAWTYR